MRGDCQAADVGVLEEQLLVVYPHQAGIRGRKQFFSGAEMPHARQPKGEPRNLDSGRQLRMSWMIWPWTSVRRMSRPL